MSVETESYQAVPLDLSCKTGAGGDDYNVFQTTADDLRRRSHSSDFTDRSPSSSPPTSDIAVREAGPRKRFLSKFFTQPKGKKYFFSLCDTNVLTPYLKVEINFINSLF
mgnify:CR=1 FL=1